MSASKNIEHAPCPCGSARFYGQCCAPLHRGEVARTAEALMRSRYCAYVLGLTDYLRQSWHPGTRPEQLDIDPHAKWLGLAVRHHQQEADEALVEFVARYKIKGRAFRLHEISRFVRENGRWFYRDGQFPEHG